MVAEPKMKFKQIVRDFRRLGKKTFECDVPHDIILKADDTGRKYVGVGFWFGSRLKFVCFVSKNGAIFLNEEAFRQACDLFENYGKTRARQEKKRMRGD